MSALAGTLRPAGIPAGVDPREWRKSIEARLNELLDQSFALITALDLMEADCDLEPVGDEEPWLGWPEHRGPSQLGAERDDDREQDDADSEPVLGASEYHPTPIGHGRDGQGSQVLWAAFDADEREVENEHGGDIVDEPHDEDTDSEPLLGWSNSDGAPGPMRWDAVDADESGGAGLRFTGEGRAIARQVLGATARPSHRLETDVLTILRPGVGIVSSL